MSFVDNKKIAKNTVLLYIRMLLVMGVSLYTTRVILKILGIDDYGIYTLIGGFISLFSIISNSLVSAIQRYFNVALGIKDDQYYNHIYSMSINILILLSLVFLVLAETIGLWFVSSKLNIPADRENAAWWVYQISVLTLIVQLFRSSDNASIIAHEEMQFFAILGIVEVFLKLIIVFALVIVGGDKLIVYTVLYLLTTLLINIIYKLYCSWKFKACRYQLYWDKKLLKELGGFSGWTLMGNGVQLGVLQAENFLLNHYHSVSVNAARGVASQVYNAVNTFLVNYQTAFQPQVMKTFVASEYENHIILLYRSSRLSFFLLLIIMMPVLFNMESLLGIWLEQVPPYTKEFCVFVLLAYLVDALSAPLAMSISASGKIRGSQIVLSVVFLLQLFASFITLSLHVVPYIVSVNILFSHILMFISYLYFAHKHCDLAYVDYMKSVLTCCALVLITASVIPMILHGNQNGNIIQTIGYIMLDILWTFCTVLVIGLNKAERRFVKSFIVDKMKRG